MKFTKLRVKVLMVLVFSLLGFAVMGYHPGIEDDAVYLAAVKTDLQPTLFPHDSEFFRLQLQATVFDKSIATFVAATHISVAWAEFLWQFSILFSILWASQSIAQQLFDEPRAQWAGVALLAAMFTLPVAGTALYLVDQHLHPRAIATALILFAIQRILARKRWQAAPLLALALVMHPIMAAFGVSFCMFLVFFLADRTRRPARSGEAAMAGAMPLGWIFEPPSRTWRDAMQTRTYYFLFQWTWYEWLGALAPLALFWFLHQYAKRRGATLLARFALAMAAYGVFQQAVAMIILGFPPLVRMTPLQPMRFLHLVYLFMTLFAGCLFGRHVLKSSLWRWAAFLTVTNVGMLIPQRAMFGTSPHLEWPGRKSDNQWLCAFAWIRQNTPRDAYFAVDPYYMTAPGEDYHGFRALAERSQMADAVKDTAVVTQVPQLGPEWARQTQAEEGWTHFQIADFERLKREFGVDWALVSHPPPTGLVCPWHDDRLAVCRIP